MMYCIGNSEIRYGTVFPHTQGVIFGDIITITCYSTTLAQWKYRGHSLRFGKYVRSFGNTIYIHNADARHSGEYKCIGTLPGEETFKIDALVYVGSKLSVYNISSLFIFRLGITPILKVCSTLCAILLTSRHNVIFHKESFKRHS